MMFDLMDINSWKKRFGLFPVPIKSMEMSRYALLNGGLRDFCMEIHPESENIHRFESYAWSANTKNYVTVSPDTVTIYNWLKDSREDIKASYVADNIRTFYKYIGANNYDSENDVVPFILKIFRQMRNMTRETESPLYALNLLYLLLLSLQEDVSTLDYAKWKIKNVPLPGNFDHFIEEIRTGIASLTPDLEIILRHCSGPIFQEAHRDVLLFESDMDLFGGISSKMKSSAREYTSAHYTPQFVARSIVEQCLDQLDLSKDCITVLDPACGSAEFLMEFLKQLQIRKYRGRVIVRGRDFSESAVSTSTFLLNYENETCFNERLYVDVRRTEDSLAENWGRDADVILMNPPFVSWDLMDVAQRETVSFLFPGMPKPNLAVAFIKKALDSIADCGIIGCVLPSSILTFDSYKDLREQLASEFTTYCVGKLGSYVFETALTDVSIYIGKKAHDVVRTRLLWCRNEKGVAQKALCELRRMEANGQVENAADSYNIYEPVSYPDSQGSWKIISRKEACLKNRLSESLALGTLVPLRSIFDVKQGIRTGNNSLFIIDELEYSLMSENEQKYYRKSVDNAAISDSRLDSKHYVWYPYNQSGLVIRSEEQLRSAAPLTYGRIFPFKDKLASRKSLRGMTPWWGLSWYRSWLTVDKCRIVSAEFGNSRSFALDITGEYAVERGYAWLPLRQFVRSDYYFYLAYFSSRLFDDLLSIYSRQLAGAFCYDLSPKFSGQIPVPDVSSGDCRTSSYYMELAALGEALTKEGSYYYMDKIDYLVRKLTGSEDDRGF